MTENEAIKELKEAIECCTSGEDEHFKEALGMGILALEEIQQYRAIGTIEEFRQAMRFKEYFMELYDEGLEVANWHKNGDLEPLVNFIDEACS